LLNAFGHKRGGANAQHQQLPEQIRGVHVQTPNVSASTLYYRNNQKRELLPYFGKLSSPTAGGFPKGLPE
jgi:hypothetical protein